MMQLNKFVAGALMLLSCFTCNAQSEGVVSSKMRDFAVANVWELARQADLVVVADVTGVDTNITLSIKRVLKGEMDDTVFTFAAPPQPATDVKMICRPRPRGWQFVAGETWVLFFKKAEGHYRFLDGRKSQLPEIEHTIRQSVEVQAMTDDSSKVKRLVEIVMRSQMMSSYAAFSTLSTLNRPEFLDLLAPLGKAPQYRQFYISLLHSNKNPKTIELLRSMLYTEESDNLRDVIDAFGRKDEKNEDVSMELVPFLEHPDPVIRRSCVFILNYRDYHNGFPLIVKALDDPDPRVRASALYWPWYAYVKEHPEVKAKIKKLRKDPDAQVRDAAKRALAGISKWYRLWYFHR